MPARAKTQPAPRTRTAPIASKANPSTTSACRAFTAAAAVVQILAPTLHPLTDLGQSVGAMANMTPNFATPAGFTFAIWWPIFLLSLAYAWHQSRGPQAGHLVFRHLGWWPGITFALSALWMLLAQFYGNGWYLVIIIVAMLACMLHALRIAFPQVNTTMGNTGKWVVLPLVGLFAGWLTVAAFLNIASVNQLASNLIWPLMPVQYAIATLTPAALFGLALVLRMGPRFPWATQWVGYALIWALFGTIAANSTYEGLTSSTVGTFAFILAAFILAAMAFTQYQAGKRPPAATTRL